MVPLSLADRAARFAERVVIRESGCHEWTGARNGAGYGSLGVGGRRTALAHRWLMEQLLGRPLARDELVLHTCDNPPCVNPWHLYLGDQGDNNRDAVVRGRAWTPLGLTNAGKTHCPQGHPYDDQNTLPIRYGRLGGVGRQCRECARQRNRVHSARRRVAG